MQRLTKYKLLLKAILKKTDKESHRKDLIQMVSVIFLACDVTSTILLVTSRRGSVCDVIRRDRSVAIRL